MRTLYEAHHIQLGSSPNSTATMLPSGISIHNLRAFPLNCKASVVQIYIHTCIMYLPVCDLLENEVQRLGGYVMQVLIYANVGILFISLPWTMLIWLRAFCSCQI